MANSQSAKKRIRQNETRRKQNQRIRTRMRTQIKKFEKAVQEGDVAQAEELFGVAESHLDRAVIKGIIPKKRASRKTSRLAKRLNNLRESAS